GLAVDERLLDLLDEQPLAADLRERHVEDLVAARLDHVEADRQVGRDGEQARLDVLRLPEGERAAAGGDDELVHVAIFLSCGGSTGSSSAACDSRPSTGWRSNSSHSTAARSSASSRVASRSAVVGWCSSLLTTRLTSRVIASRC